MHRSVRLFLSLALAAGLASAAPPKPVFYLPFEGATAAALAGGAAGPLRRAASQSDPILELLSLNRQRFVPGVVGFGYDIGDQPLTYECAGNFRPDEGTCSFWVCPEWDGTDQNLYSTLFGAADWGMVYKYQNQSSLTFGTAKPDRDLYYDCGAPDIRGWKAGQWQHVAVTWSRKENQRRIYVDGARQGQGPFPYHKPVTSGPLFVGAGCTLYPQPTAHAALDEFALWDAPLDAAAIAEVAALGRAGRPVWEVPAAAAPSVEATTPPANPAAPPPPEPDQNATTTSGPRTTVALDGWWAFVPLATEQAAMPTTGWGRSRVPGYWTVPGDTRGPDGQPVTGSYAGRPWAQYGAACYQRTFLAEAAWQGRRVLLQVGGVDGLAQVYVNGRPLGWLPGWAGETYDVGALLRPGQPNSVAIVLRARGGAPGGGLYDGVRLIVTPGPFVESVAIRPRVPAGQLEVSCDVLAPAGEAVLEFTVTAKSDPQQVVRRFTQPCRPTTPADGVGLPERLTGRLSRLAATFDWPDAHPWTIDDPFLYDLAVTLRVGGEARDQAGPYRFGFRELTRQGAEFLLNGRPFHLRGHQIDLPWGQQMDRVRELKPAGMNCLELSGPISSDWYRGTPYQWRQFAEILDYCDEQGLVTIPHLPDAMVLKERILEPVVARHYQRRLDQFVRTWGNHPSVGLWYMHFNLAGYRWYVAPSKLDGSYKPDDPAFQAKERYALEAQRLAREVDDRPLYHHACGNLGDMLTSNLYLGPNSPTQEREEWPSAWAAKKPFPFLAAEHCCWLIPYWFRPRQFPLSVVYAGEPIFDELNALLRGPAAYADLTPELFDLYDLDRTPRGTRLRTLIQRHPGYQAVKAQIARQSLRAWRTWGVSGIIFNAENWDFKDAAGEPLPMMRAVARYFGDTDLYLAGAPGDWPSKDHACYAGETVRRQVVLLNDLQRDLPVTLRWRVTAGEREVAAGRLTATAQAGVPTFVPLEFNAPAVTERTALRLSVEPVEQTGQHFQPENATLEVFPKAAPPEAPTGVLLWDPVGDTSQVLRAAGVGFAPLTAQSPLAEAKLLVVGRRGWDAAFEGLAKSLGLDQAVRAGLRVVVFEQTAGTPCGLRLAETSTREVFVGDPASPLLAGLKPADFFNLRGRSDLLEPYPDAPPETRTTWPARCWKWGNRGIVATWVYHKPHLSPFRPVLQCGYDLVQSPLLEARFGRGSVVLCQVDVTPRYGVDPVSTRLVANLLQPVAPSEPLPASFVGASATPFLSRWGVRAEPFRPGAGGVVFVGGEAVDAALAAQLEAAARGGATVVLLPRPGDGPLGLRLRDERWCIGRVAADPLLVGLTDGDVYPKAWTTTPGVVAGEGWRRLVEPGLLAVRAVGQGRVLAFQLDPARLSPRGRVKALRFWSVLLANLGVDRAGASLTAPGQVTEDHESEQMPPYMNW